MADEVVSMWHPSRMDEITVLETLLRLLQTEDYYRIRMHTTHLDVVLDDDLAEQARQGWPNRGD